ncbi:MAG TPA: STAS-like domain-containing protein [Candidatus Acidoferrum sp.]|nr:STAS-like domain-containing protein [Candidatus Acidoferrum sp.]
MPAILHRTVPGARCASRFSGVKTLTSSFLNAALGCLFASFSVDTLTQKLKYIGLDPTDEKLVRLVVTNAIRFYAATPEQQQAMAAATSRAFEY